MPIRREPHICFHCVFVVQEEVPGFGFTNSAYWVRFQVSNESNADADWVLLIDSTPFYVDAYFPSTSNNESNRLVLSINK